MRTYWDSLLLGLLEAPPEVPGDNYEDIEGIRGSVISGTSAADQHLLAPFSQSQLFMNYVAE
jgi:hypothetical protein